MQRVRLLGDRRGPRARQHVVRHRHPAELLPERPARHLPQIHPAAWFGSFVAVSRVTTDGVLIGSDEFNGSTVWAMDLATGQEVSFGERNSTLWAWRSTKPRGLVSAFTNIAAPGGNSQLPYPEGSG